MGAQHCPDLRNEDRLAAEDLAAIIDQGAGCLVVLDVLNDPAIDAVLVALASVVAQALDRAGASADALDRGDLLLQGEDRLDLQSRANPGACAADAAAAPPRASGDRAAGNGSPARGANRLIHR